MAYRLKHRLGVTESDPLPAYADGGYPIIYIVAYDSGTVCAECAMELDGEEIADFAVYYEGPTIECAECGKAIESAYGDPDAEDED